MSNTFQHTFNDKGEKPRFLHKPNPLVPRAYQIFEFHDEKHNYEPVGDYVVLDEHEEQEITEKKMINLMAIMNEKKPLVDFKNLTNERILYNIVTTDENSEQQKVLFRAYDGSGVSKENAMLTLDRSIFDE